MVDIHFHLGNEEDSQTYIRKIKEHSLSKDDDVQYELNRRQGRSSMRKGKYFYALKHFKQGLSLAKKKNDLIWLGKSHNDVGAIYRLVSDYEEAIRHYEKSLEFKIQIGNLYLIATTQRNIGIVYTHMEDSANAIYFYEQALSSYMTYIQTPDYDERVNHSINHIYQDLALAYKNIGKFNLAKKYKQLIIENYPNLTSNRDQTNALLSIAKLDFADHDYNMAKNRLIQAIEISDGQHEHTPELYYQLAKTYQASEEISQAISTAEKGLEEINSVNDSEIEMYLHELLANLYAVTNQFKVIEHLYAYQSIREKFLQNKYNNSIKARQHKLVLIHKEKDMADQLVLNLQKSIKIENLQKKVAAFILLLLSAISWIYFLTLKRKQERKELRLAIKSHQQQLSLLAEEQVLTKSDSNSQLQNLLVEVMILLVNVWEKHTGQDKIDLAEKSKAWRVTIDNGTLRTRSLDKYMNIKSIPKFPRWKNVIKTCHFILSQKTLPTEDRISINNKLDAIMQLVKQ